MNIKRFVIFGDSYSTHKDHIPDGYAYYYCDGGRDAEVPVTKMLASETWWGRFLNETGAELVQNDSWSGSTIGYTGYMGVNASTSSFITRYLKHYDAGFFKNNEIDTVFVFGGTNDSWANAPLGEIKYEDFEDSDLFCVFPAICYLMKRLKEDLNGVRVIFIANCEIKISIVECMKAAAKKFGAQVIVLHDVDKECGHPTKLGMKQICEQIIASLE